MSIFCSTRKNCRPLHAHVVHEDTTDLRTVGINKNKLRRPSPTDPSAHNGLKQVHRTLAHDNFCNMKSSRLVDHAVDQNSLASEVPEVDIHKQRVVELPGPRY